MADDFNNPYTAPRFGDDESQRNAASIIASVRGMVVAPAICLIVVASLGLIASVFNTVFPLFVAQPPVDPNAPEIVRSFQQGANGPAAMIVQGGFIVLNLVILFCAIQMYGLRSWGASLTAAILAMVNLGTCCCVLGLPVGIWSVVVLMNSNVKDAFAAASR